MLKKILTTNYLHITVFIGSIVFWGCSNPVVNTSFTQTTRITTNLPKVVATTSVLCDLTKQIADNTINLICLMPPDVDPDVYRPTPEDRQALEQAKLILYNGYNLESGLIKTIQATKTSAPKIAVGQLAIPQPQQLIENGKRVSNPYVWHDAKNAMKMVTVISANLKKIAPDNAMTYSSNRKRITNELTQLERWIKSRIASIPTNRRKLVTTHNAFGYYARAYNLALTNSLAGLNTQQGLTSARVQSLVQGLKKAKVPIIFAEATNNPNLVQTVAKNAQVRISPRKLYTYSIGEPGSEAESYQTMMVANTRTIVEGLGGTYLIFEPKTSQ
jgi:manganese/iron transport system substrate-binding protein